MLSPSDADLVRRDPALPGLPTVLDPDALVDALRPSLPDAALDRAQAVYVRYKPGTSCLVGYQLDVAGTVVEAYAKAYRPDARNWLQEAGEQDSVPGLLGPGRIVLEDRATIVSLFPHDGKLKSLARLASSQNRELLLRKLLPERPDLWKGTIRSLRYKPERRYVGQILTGDGTPGAVLKVYSGPEYHAAQSNGKAFGSQGVLRVPRRLGRSERHCLVAFEWMQGRLLSEAISGTRREPQVVLTVGAALAELHATNPKSLARLTREAEARALFSVANGLRFLCPNLAERTDTLARQLAARLMDSPPMDRPIHGDFYAKQVLLADGSVIILDLDQAVRGDPAADLGLFFAHLERDALRDALSPQEVEQLSVTLLDGYRARLGYLPARVDLYRAIGLLRLMPEPFRYREASWPERTGMLLERAETILKAETTCVPGRHVATVMSSPAWDGATQRAHSTSSVSVLDPFGIADDPKMPFLAQALDPVEGQREFERHLPPLTGEYGIAELRSIRVVRYKPGRRCLIEYVLEQERLGASSMVHTLVGKVRARGLDVPSYRLSQSLWNAGFGADSEDGISVPEPVGIIPRFQMWLQRKVPGGTATQLLAKSDGVALARRTAEAIHKLHRANIPPRRRHTMADELRILHERLPLVSEREPRWASRLERLLEDCDRLGGATPEPTLRGIHRDFYPDQIIVDGHRLYVIDFDLYCEGDPGLDVGNFLGHVTEQSMRIHGEPDALRDREEAFEERFLELSGEVTQMAVQAYKILTLVRHIYLSTQFSERCQITEPLIELCEEYLSRQCVYT